MPCGDLSVDGPGRRGEPTHSSCSFSVQIFIVWFVVVYEKGEARG